VKNRKTILDPIAGCRAFLDGRNTAPPPSCDREGCMMQRSVSNDERAAVGAIESNAWHYLHERLETLREPTLAPNSFIPSAREAGMGWY